MATNNKGFSIVEVFIVILVLAVAVFIGWKVWDTMNTPKVAPPIAPASEEIKTDQDLDKADKTLNDTNIEGDEAQQLDAEVSF